MIARLLKWVRSPWSTEARVKRALRRADRFIDRAVKLKARG